MKSFTLKGLLCGLAILGFMAITPKAEAALSGSYTINKGATATSTNYRSFAAFASDLNYGTRTDGGTANGPGVSGAVTATVTSGSGPYTEQVTFYSISGVSSTNTVTIDGNGETLQYTARRVHLTDTF